MKYMCLECNQIFESDKVTEERICPHCKTERRHQLLSLTELSDFELPDPIET